MKIRNVLHRGLRRFIARDDASGLPSAVVERVRTIVTFLQEMEDPGELRDVPGWRVHRLAGDRRGTWSLTVTRNWRLTFRIDRTAKEIFDLDYAIQWTEFKQPYHQWYRSYKAPHRWNRISLICPQWLNGLKFGLRGVD
jgi:toxin HigB-1